MKTMTELWKPFPMNLFENKYLISNTGRVRLLLMNGKECDISVQPYDNGGYNRVTLYDINNKQKKFLVHRLVAMTFIENKENKDTVNHRDGNKRNNNVNNLEWATRSENLKHAHDTGLKGKGTRGSNHGMAKLTEEDVLKIRSMLDKSNTYLADLFKVHRDTIGLIRNRKTWRHV